MFRRFTAILLLFSVPLMSLNCLWVYTGFRLNQNYIAAKLCVNKSRPMLHCRGKCFLSKQLKKASGEEKNNENRTVKEATFEAYCPSALTFTPQITLLATLTTQVNSALLPRPKGSVFRPPATSSSNKKVLS